MAIKYVAVLDIDFGYLCSVKAVAITRQYHIERVLGFRYINFYSYSTTCPEASDYISATQFY